MTLKEIDQCSYKPPVHLIKVWLLYLQGLWCPVSQWKKSLCYMIYKINKHRCSSCILYYNIVIFKANRKIRLYQYLKYCIHSVAKLLKPLLYLQPIFCLCCLLLTVILPAADCLRMLRLACLTLHLNTVWLLPSVQTVYSGIPGFMSSLPLSSCPYEGQDPGTCCQWPQYTGCFEYYRRK